MKVFNISKNSVVVEDILVADTVLKKTKGLLKRVNPAALFFKTRWGIHTFGMNFPIDCVICDDNFEVKVIREKILSNRFFFWNPKYKNVFELPIGTIKNSKTKIGDKFDLIN